MASSSSSQHRHFLYSLLLLLLILLPVSCTGTRLGDTRILEEALMDSDRLMKLRKQKLEMGLRFQDPTFNFFPKGTPIPPSGPSKRHNKVVNSIPHN